MPTFYADSVDDEPEPGTTAASVPIRNSMLELSAFEAVRRQAAFHHRTQLAALRSGSLGAWNSVYVTAAASAASLARNPVMDSLAAYGPRPADTFRYAFAFTAVSRTLAAQMTPLLDLSRQQAAILRTVPAFTGPDLAGLIPDLGAWYRQFGDQVTRIADNLLPANVRPFGDDDWSMIFEISAEDAMALAWAPRTSTVRELLAAPDRDARLAVLEKRRESVLQDLDTGFANLTHPELLELGELGQRAVAAAQADMPEAALALCASLVETLMEGYGMPWLRQEYPELFTGDKPGIGRALSKAWAKAPGAGARAFSYIRWLVIADLRDSFQHEGAARDRFNRHRIAHQAGRDSYKAEYTLPALLTVHALMHLIEWHVDLPDEEPNDPVPSTSLDVASDPGSARVMGDRNRDLGKHMENAWQVSRTFSEKVSANVGQDARFTAKTHSAYDTWNMEPSQAGAHTATAMALALHSLLLDQAAQGTELGRALETTTVGQVVDALRTRPEHELFAGLPDDMTGPDQELVASLKQLAYSEHDPTRLQWVRLAYQAREFLRHYAATLPAQPTCAAALQD